MPMYSLVVLTLIFSFWIYPAIVPSAKPSKPFATPDYGLPILSRISSPWLGEEW
jgi:hypothetical protein